MGLGQHINMNMPYSVPPYNFGGYTNAESNASEKKEKKITSYTEFIEIAKQKQEEKNKINAQITELNKQSKDLGTLIDKGKNGKVQEDGTIRAKETWSDYKKLSPWKKLLRAGSNLLQGGWKAATSLIGYETDKKTGERKFNPVKLAINTVIAGACIALCACTAPISLPIIGATTVGAAASGTLLAAGGAFAVAGIVKGAIGIADAIKKKNVAKLDNACQDVGEGVTIGVATVAGGRAMGTMLQSYEQANNAATVARVVSRNPFTKLSNFLTRTEYVKGSNKFTQYFYDSTINASRSIAYKGRQGRIDFSNKGFFKSSWANIKDSVPKLGKSEFETTKKDVTNTINSRIREITQELNNPNISGISKALLKNEQKLLKAQLKDLNNTVSKNAWKGLREKSRTYKETEEIKNAIKELETLGKTKLYGQKIKNNDTNLKALKELADRSKKLSKQINNLAKVRHSTIKNMSYFKRFKSDVEAYTEQTRNNRFRRFYDVRKLSKSDFTFWNIISSPFKSLFFLLGLEFKPWTYIQKSPASTAYKAQEVLTPEYEEGFLTSGLMADATKMGDQTLKTKVTTQNENGESVEQEVAVTNNDIEQMEKQKKQIDEALANAKSEQLKAFTA